MMSHIQPRTIQIRPTSRHYYFNIRVVNIILQIICLVGCICIFAIPEEILNPNHEHGHEEQEASATQPILALVAVCDLLNPLRPR